ncbi:MAG: hypothetical protein ABIJ96_05585 [Elusimicrobiota bacterium]
MNLLPLVLAGVLPLTASALDIKSVPETPGQAVETREDDSRRRARDQLLDDPAAADMLAARILRSSIGPQIAEQDSPRARETIRGWITAHPEDAAHLAVGFAQDDADGGDAFEQSLHNRIVRLFEVNPERHRGMVDRLESAARETRKIIGEEDIKDEERHRLIKRFFEGESSYTPDKRAGGTPAAGGGLYERLSTADLTGYSPQVQAFQSAMNRRRAPGAPALVEDGRLDHATLAYPRFGLRHDIDNLKRTLVRDATDDKQRAQALRRAENALTDFSRTAEKAKHRSGITPLLLTALSHKRRETARWIAYAAQLERLYRLRALAGFLDERLRAAIKKLPAAEKDRAGYLAHGKGLETRIRDALAAGEQAAALLAPDAGEPAPMDWARADKGFARTLAELKSYGGRVMEYKETVRLFAAAPAPRSRLRAYVDDAALRLFPNSGYARRARSEKEQTESAVRAFLRIARGRA